MRPLRIALTKGRLEKSTVALFEKAGIDCTQVHEKGRRLILPVGDGSIEMVLSKAADVITYVENGVCDMGVVGKDTIMENGTRFFEVMDLGFGRCRFALAGALVIVFSSLFSRKWMLPKRESWANVSKLALVQTVGQYVLFYVGVANSTGVHSALLTGASYLWAIVLACFLFRQEAVRKTECFDTVQAKLCMLFTLGEPMQPDQMAAVRLAMALYGGSVTSRLFLNVRERDHLCYYCSSSFQSFTGSMAVNSGVEHADAARAEQAILKELDDLRTGPITEEELEDCRLSLLSGMAGIEDSLGGIETWYYMEVLRGGAVQTPDEARAALRAVTREDVRAILRQLTLSVSYLLTREEGPAHV